MAGPSREQDRGPGAEKVELEHRLDANKARTEVGLNRPEGKVEDTVKAQRELDQPSDQGTPRGHKAQLAQPHRSGRPTGGNRFGGDEEDLER